MSLAKTQQVILFEFWQSDFSLEAETGFRDLIAKHLLSRTHVSHDELARLTYNPFEVDDDQRAFWLQRSMNRRQRALRILEMMIRVADEDEIDRVRR